MKERDAHNPGLPLGLNTWPKVYAAVLLHLLVWIALFAWLSESYR